MTTTVARVTRDYIRHGRGHSLELHDIPDRVVIYRIHGPFLFGSTDKLEELEREIALHRTDRALLLCGMRDQPARMMQRAEFHEHIGAENPPPSVEAALARARALLG